MQFAALLEGSRMWHMSHSAPHLAASRFCATTPPFLYQYPQSATPASLRTAAGYSRSAAALPLAAAYFLCSRAFAA